MTYNPRPPDEPTFAPQPKPPLPPPGRNDPPNVNREPICVWFFYDGGYLDPANPKLYIPKPPTKGTIDPDVFIPPVLRGNPPWNRWVACDDLENGDPFSLYCFIPKNTSGSSFCENISPEEAYILDTVLTKPGLVLSPTIETILATIASRLGIVGDVELYTFFQRYSIEPLPPNSDCSACTKWWVGCLKDETSFGGCPNGLVGPFPYIKDLDQDPYFKGMVFGGPTGYTSATNFVNTFGVLKSYPFESQPFGDITCVPCHEYCNEPVYNTYLECVCDNVAPGDNPPCECPEGCDAEGGGQ